MAIYKETKDYKLIHDNMLNMGDYIADGTIDCVITDPPYGLTSITKRFGKEGSAPAKEGKDGSFARLSKGFMGKEWDGSGIEYNVDAWRKCFNALKDGGYLLAFGGTRTFHRIACAIEDAGFEIRDTIMYIYGSGFPKSLNIGLAVDKSMGAEREVVNYTTDRRKDGSTYGLRHSGKIKSNEAITEQAKQWKGWGTALKPAYEPIIVARKPIKTSVAENVLKNGVGGINIDECRVGTEDISVHNAPKGTFAGGEYDRGSDTESYREHTGRFPANIIHDGSNEVVSGFPETSSGLMTPEHTRHTDGSPNGIYGKFDVNHPLAETYGDSGNASRFFYTAKASKKDRDEGLDAFDEIEVRGGGGRVEQGYDDNDEEQQRLKESASKFGAVKSIKKNTHPTVKPIELMQYLVRLVAPKGATILDCFMGSNSTGKAVMFENRERNANYKFIGIELTDEYLPICEARIEYAINKYEYDEKLEQAKTGQVSIFDFKWEEDK